MEATDGRAALDLFTVDGRTISRVWSATPRAGQTILEAIEIVR